MTMHLLCGGLLLVVYGYRCYVVISHYLRGIPINEINFNNGGWQVEILSNTSNIVFW